MQAPSSLAGPANVQRPPAARPRRRQVPSPACLTSCRCLCDQTAKVAGFKMQNASSGCPPPSAQPLAANSSPRCSPQSVANALRAALFPVTRKGILWMLLCSGRCGSAFNLADICACRWASKDRSDNESPTPSRRRNNTAAVDTPHRGSCCRDRRATHVVCRPRWPECTWLSSDAAVNVPGLLAIP